ncbi:MAG: purine-nucleoside/S-methyl-5-thioadenosine phosphorylase / adenosine deaminase [Candidatus Cloacimonadota bacterium]|nr:purine-nucleoside/S-methyl-5-thioadenosine phosphorylase / adenosine deaminase [Candidatus Cloacimonadota bacterium]
MSSIFTYLGTKDLDYRTLLRAQRDLLIGDREIPLARLVICEQTHSNYVHICSEDDCGAGFKDHPQIAGADGLATNIPQQYLVIRTADCYPVLIYDKDAAAVAAIHCGREGSRMNIAGKAVAVLVDHYGCDPANLIALIGAGICERHYEVSEELYTAYQDSLKQDQIGFCPSRDRHINIRTVIFQQLNRAGLPANNIENLHICTYENPDYFSYRRDHGNNRQINLIGIANE